MGLVESKVLRHITRTFVADVCVSSFRKATRRKRFKSANEVRWTAPPNRPYCKKYDRKYADDDKRCNHVLS
jgi:hypothetical protein